MKIRADIYNQRFGRLVAIEPTGEKRWGVHLWRCACDCGSEHVTVVNSLKKGAVKSCGCLLSETSRARQLKHGDYGSRTYKSWDAMMQRCNNPNVGNFKNYGAKGVTVCESWRSYDAFKTDMGDRPEGKSLDRIDPYGNYEPSNCRWATASEQARNKRRKFAGSFH